jgi:glycosyltransferase involved in cell wall biosynthesis
MIIGIDMRAVGQGKYSGVEEYTLNVLRALFDIDRKNKYILFSSGVKTGERYRNFTAWAEKKNPDIKVAHRGIPNRMLNIAFKAIGQPKLDNLMRDADLPESIDIIFEPNINIAPISKKAKIVATFHDLSFEKYGNFFSARQKFWHNFVNPAALANRADAIIAVSESTKRDIIETYGIEQDKIKVIYSGIAPVSRISREASSILEIRKKYHLPEKYILYLGTIEPRKNIIGLIKAFELFNTKYQIPNTKYQLMIAGSKGWLYKDIFSAARRSSAKNDIIFTDFIEDEDKKYLYGAASLFVYPSFYEGFGFPPLEAMAAGTPVITSDCSSLPEVAGGAAIMVNPYNIGQLARAIKEVLANDELQKKMIKKGYEQAEKFSWEKCARETLAVFENL